MLKALNSKSYNIISDCPNLLAGNILIKRIDGNYTEICRLSLGDKLFGDDIVIGIVKQRLSVLTINNYSCSNIINDNGNWILLSDKCNDNNLVEKFDIYYNIVTTKGYFYTSDYIVRDYLEVHDINIYNKIADKALSILNLDADISPYQCATLN
jgi:hypothetical protein